MSLSGTGFRMKAWLSGAACFQRKRSRGRALAGLGLRDCADERQGQPRGKLAGFNEHYSPKIVGYLNDYKLAVVKVLGEFVWHKHDETDDFLLAVADR